MKKTLTVNLNGIVFHIDENAYQLLEKYLSNLRVLFSREEGTDEIMNDFEARISELLNDRVQMGFQVITIEHIEEVIKRMGKPEEIFQEEQKDQEEHSKAEKTESVGKTKKRLMRNPDDRVLGGVASGFSFYIGCDVVIIRLILIGLLFIGFPLAIAIYVVLWLVLPLAKTAADKLMMRGENVNLENIGKIVAAESASVSSNLLASFLKVCLVIFGCLIGLPVLFVLFIVIVVLVAVMLGIGGGLLGLGGGLLGFMPSFLIVKYPVLSTITGILVLIIPVVAIIYSIVAHFARLKPVSQLVKWTFRIIWILSLILFFFSGFRINRNNWHDNKWKWTAISNYNEIRGNNIPSQKTIDLDEPVNYFELGKFLHANVQIEQIWDEAPTIEINGDDNLVKEVKYELKNGRLILFSENRLHRDSNLKIKLRANKLKTVQVENVGNVRMSRAFTGDEFEIKMNGIGSFRADSLYVNSLTVRTEGVGSVNLSGKAIKTNLQSGGIGSVDGMELLSDTVYARVDGIGSIKCNPVEFLDARVDGIGSITYKEEPKNKNTRSSGIGKIRKR